MTLTPKETKAALAYALAVKKGLAICFAHPRYTRSALMEKKYVAAKKTAARAEGRFVDAVIAANPKSRTIK